MRPSRGMGAVAPTKIPKAKQVVRKDNPQDITVFKDGGMAKNWIAGAIKNKGALRKELGVKGDKTIPAKKLATAAKAPGKLGQRARLAQTLKKMKG